MPASSFSDVLQRLDEVIQNPLSILSNDAERLDEAIQRLPPELLETVEKNPEDILNLECLREMIYEDSLEDFFEETREIEEVSHSSYFM